MKFVRHNRECTYYLHIICFVRSFIALLPRGRLLCEENTTKPTRIRVHDESKGILLEQQQHRTIDNKYVFHREGPNSRRNWLELISK